MRYFSIPNWEDYQHYKDRDPPWIKFHTKSLESYEISVLPDHARAHLFLLWLLAARMGNRMPWDAQFIQESIHATEPVDLEMLAAHGRIVESFEAEEREKWPSRHVPQALRSKLLRDAKNQCSECAATEHLEIDHIVPVSQGGESVEDNLQVLCRPCNRRKRVKLQGLRSNLLRSDAPLRSLETEAETETKAEAERKPAHAREAAPPDHFHAQYDPAFKTFMKELQATYPEHAGRSNWRKAEEGVVALLNDGYTHDRIRGAVMRKRAFHEAKGDLGTEFVMNPGNFFADPENIDNLWRPPVQQQRKTRKEEAAEHNWQTLQALQRRDSDEAGRAGRVQQGDPRGSGVSRPQIASNGG